MSIPNWWGDWRPGLTPHTGNLQATDLIECTQIVGGLPVNTVMTGAQILGAVPTPSVAWGSITGTLSSQTDLSTALSGKASTGAVTGTGITMSTARILGRSTAGTGAIEEISIGTGLTLSAGTLSASGGGLTVGTTAISSGTVGRILFEGTGNVLQQSANLFWDNTNGRLGIGTASPSSFLNVVSSSATIPSLLISGTNPYSGSPVRDYITINGTGNVGISLITNTGGFVAQRFYSGTTELGVFYCQESTKDFVFKNSQTGFMDFQTGGNISRLRIFNGGNVAIGTTTDAGFKLDVNGTARVTGNSSFIGVTKLYNGSTLPSNNYPLNVYTTANGIASFEYGTTTGGGFLQFLRAGAAAGIIRSSYAETYDMVLYAGNWGSTNGIAIRPANIGGVKIGGDNTTITHENSAILNVESTTKGFLPPRMTTTQKNAIASPAAGLVVYDTTLNKLCVRTASAWETITSI